MSSVQTLTAILFALQGVATVVAQPILPEAPIIIPTDAAVPVTPPPATVGDLNITTTTTAPTISSASPLPAAPDVTFAANNNNSLGAGTIFAQQSASVLPTIERSSEIVIAVGNSDGSPIIANVVPRGPAAFKGFDMRPKNFAVADFNSPIGGYSSLPVWDGESVKRCYTNSSKGFTSSSAYGSVSSSTDVSKKVHGEDKLKLSFFGFDAEQSFGYDSTNNASASIVSAYTYNHASLGGKMLSHLENLKLLEDPKNKLQSGNIEDFLNDYGTHWISTVTYGCDASAIYQYACTSSTATEVISAGLSGGFFGQTADAKTKIDSYVNSKTCTMSTYWHTVGTVEGIQLPPTDKMQDYSVMSKFWNDFSDHCSREGGDNGQLLQVYLGNWLEVPAIREAVGNNQDALNQLQFWGAMDQQSMIDLGQAGRYLSLVQQALDKLDTPQCKNALDPWAKTGLFDRQHAVGDSNVNIQYWDNLAQKHADFKSKFFATAGFENYVNKDTIADAIKNNHALTSLVKMFTSNAHQLYREAAELYHYAYCDIKATFIMNDAPLRNLQASNYAMEASAAAGPVINDGQVMGGRDLVFQTPSYRFYVWGRFYAKKSNSDSRLYKPVFTIDGQWRFVDGQNKEYYHCGFSTKTIETEGNIRQSHLDLYFDDRNMGMCQDYFGVKTAVEVEVDYVMPDITYASY